MFVISKNCLKEREETTLPRTKRRVFPLPGCFPEQFKWTLNADLPEASWDSCGCSPSLLLDGIPISPSGPLAGRSTTTSAFPQSCQHCSQQLPEKPYGLSTPCFWGQAYYLLNYPQQPKQERRGSMGPELGLFLFFYY